MSSMQNLYTGSAGQAAVMSEFLIRGYNVAVPEVDRGDDLFVVQDDGGEFWRAQIKTAIAKPKQSAGYSARFILPIKQLEAPNRPELHYFFMVRHQDRWSDIIVLSRKTLHTYQVNHGLGSLNQDKSKLTLYLSFTPNDIVCSKLSLKRHRDDFSLWPALIH